MEAIKRFWTIKEVRYIQANPHLTIGELSEYFGRSYKSVAAKRCRLLPGLNKKRGKHSAVTPEEKAKIYHLRSEGFNPNTIARMVDRTPQCIYDLLKTA